MARLSPWLMTPVLVAGSWLLSAQSPATDQITALEKRIAELEARIGKDGNVTRIKAPFQVLAADGTPLLYVSEARPKTGGVLITRQASGGALFVLDAGGDYQAGMGISEDDFGVLYAYNRQGKIAAQMSGSPGFAIWNKEGDNVAVLNASSTGGGRLSLWNNDVRIAMLEDSAGAGNLTLMKGSNGQAIVRLGMVGGAGRLAVMGNEGKIGASLMGDVDGGGFLGLATRTGQTFAQGSITDDGRGLFQVFMPGGIPVAVMGQGGEGAGGIFQVRTAGGLKGTFGTASAGGGMLQLVSQAGTTTVEAGTTTDGRGIVRVGPYFKCSPITPSTPVMAIPGWTDCIMGSKNAK